MRNRATNTLQKLCVVIGTIFFGVTPAIASDEMIGGEIVNLSDSAEVVSIAWSPDGSHLATGSQLGGHVTLWDLRSGSIKWKVRKQFGTSDLAFTKDGEFVVAPSNVRRNDVVLSLISVSDGGQVKLLTDQPPASGSVFTQGFSLSPDGSVLASGLGSNTGMIALYDTSSWTVQARLGPWVADGGWAAAASHLAIDPSRRLLVIGVVNGEIKIWNLANNTMSLKFRPYSSGLKSMAYDAVNGIIFTGGSAAQLIAIPSSNGGDKKNPLAGDAADSLVRSYDPATGNRLRTLAGPGGSANSISVSCDGHYVAATRDGGYLLVWDANTGTLLGTVSHNSGAVHGVAFSPRGDELAYAIGSSIRILSLNPKKS